ncbi:FtsQ-type POTRA domain-containing protein [Agromyces sp. MMS24-K17]|uniref:FtsQ-type POTRA domain-containing protein n=1 Tax=Agromyces sp. MMS24-K17 TaxID=3372850 RepID=UPI0037552938
MRRPQGFDQPPVRRQVAPAAAPARADAPHRATAAPAGRPADRTTTEPIPLPGPAAAAPATAATPRSAVAADASTPADRPKPADAPSPRDASRDAPPADARSARRAIARAAKERRRFERQEVRRFTARSRRRRITWGVAIGAVLVVAAGTLAVAYSPLMALREVRVEGTQRIPATDVVDAFSDDLGTPLALVTSADVQQALSGFPLIETYSIETIPPQTIVVRIVERTPVGVIEADGGLELVDAAGVVIDRPAERPEGQPLISAGPVTSEGFRAAAAVIRNLPADVRAQLVGASAETADDVRLELAGGASVVWGSAEHPQKKADVLAALMRAVPPDTTSYYDISSPDSAVVG